MEPDHSMSPTLEAAYDLLISQVMTRKVLTVAPDTPMADLRHPLRTKRISGMPVCVKGELVGVISLEDFINWMADGARDKTVGDCMTPNPESVSENASVVEAIRKFHEFEFGRLPVVDETGRRVAGVITKGDIIRGMLRKMGSKSLSEDISTYRASHIFEDIIADHASLVFEYSVNGKDFHRGGQCSSCLKKTLKRLGFAPDIIRRVSIACYEAEMNMVIYADHGKIRAEVDPHRITVVFADRGPGIEDVERAMYPGFSTAPDFIRELGFGAGMGLPNIRRFSDKMDIKSEVGKGTELTIEIALSKNEGAS